MPNKKQTLIWCRKSSMILTFLLVVAASIFAQANILEFEYDFRAGANGWAADFADYPPNIGSGYALNAGIRLLPRKLTRLPQRGFYIQGHNRSADLFMFLKRRLTTADGIGAGRAYRIEYVITFASNAATGCVGIGGAPGESVYLKAGAAATEPLAVLQPNGYLRLNVDKGNQAQGGTAASAAGNIANGIPCEQASPFYPFASIRREHQHPTIVTANPTGDLWLLIGTDAGFEGLTRIYYQKIRVKLIPV